MHRKKQTNEAVSRSVLEQIRWERDEAFDTLERHGLSLGSNADVVKVRHGEWVMRGGRFRCSECDGKALMQDVGGTGGFSHEFEQLKSDFCPNCGAKMDGKERE